MGTYINKGNSGFAKYVNGEFVDKTMIVAFVNSTLNTESMLTCVTRPRRFGKSLAANMLYAYYDRSCDSAELFSNYNVSKDDSYLTHLNKYPSIYIDITDFITRYGDSDQIVEKLQEKVSADVIKAFPNITYEADADLMDILLSVCNGTGEKFIMIIDEWDAMCRELSDKPYIMDQYINLLRRMFKGGDTAKVFAGVYMTGILPIKKYGTQSALNDFREYSMTSSGALGAYFGFSDSDVRMLAEKHKMNVVELKQWYDGYELDTFDWKQPGSAISKVSIYNPNSVMTAIRTRKCDNYWSRTESFEALQQYIDMDYDGVKNTLEELVKGNAVYLHAMRFGNDLNCVSNNEELFTLLTHYGYLSYDQDTRMARLPNQEIREEFVEALRGSVNHKELSALIRTSDSLLQSTWQMDEDSVAEGIEYIHNHKVAPTFYNNEQALRSVVRLAYLGAVDHYIDIQELPSGKGYADLVFVPRSNTSKPVMVVELKWNESSESAIAQIKKRDYPEMIKSLSGNLLLVGISYDPKSKEHSCRIEALKGIQPSTAVNSEHQNIF